MLHNSAPKQFLASTQKFLHKRRNEIILLHEPLPQHQGGLENLA